MKIQSLMIVFFVTFLCVHINAAPIQKLIVSPDGNGDYKTIQGALASLSDSASEPRLIYIKKGTYPEKVYIEKHHVILEGEDKEGVIITKSIARDEWRCEHQDDWGVATVNINANDITLMSLTVINNYGYECKVDKIIYCAADTLLQQKIIPCTGHQMAVRTMNATRFKAINCHFKSYAGDTMSPWNVKSGLFYFQDCTMEGGVDLYCPRGWAYARNCTFIVTRGDAAIWHDGSQVQDSRTVLDHCSFEGYDGFQLGRYHRDAQFYLLNCTFAQNMADQEIYKVPTKNILKWGHRVFYYNCHRVGGDFTWFADNIISSSIPINPSDLDVNWVFDNKWNPLKN